MTQTGKTDETIDSTALHIEFALGLIAGEGSFYLTFAKDDRRQYGVTPGIRCEVNMGQFSKPLLQRVADTLNLGRVTDHEAGHTWTVSSRAECHELHDLIEAHRTTRDSGFPHSSKHAAYQRWQVALEIMEPGKSLTKDDLLALAEIKGSINTLDGSRSRSSAEIRELIEEADE
jgi:hypothetical protein